MSSFIDAVSSQAFMQNAILGGILSSVACGVVGSYVVVKRIGYLAGGIAHSVLGGMVLPITSAGLLLKVLWSQLWFLPLFLVG